MLWYALFLECFVATLLLLLLLQPSSATLMKTTTTTTTTHLWAVVGDLVGTASAKNVMVGLTTKYIMVGSLVGSVVGNLDGGFHLVGSLVGSLVDAVVGHLVGGVHVVGDLVVASLDCRFDRLAVLCLRVHSRVGQQECDYVCGLRTCHLDRSIVLARAVCSCVGH